VKSPRRLREIGCEYPHTIALFLLNTVSKSMAHDSVVRCDDNSGLLFSGDGVLGSCPVVEKHARPFFEREPVEVDTEIDVVFTLQPQ
jgi:hypothetical protein